MRLQRIEFTGFKRFSELTIKDLPASARLIVLTGPNGVGKSSIFDGLKTWHWYNGGPGSNWDESYGAKVGSEGLSWTDRVRVEFHEPTPEDPEARKKLIYVRSAFRNESDFLVDGLGRLPSPLDHVRVNRMIDTDLTVSDNYRRLLIETISGVFSNALPEDAPRHAIRDRLIGDVRMALNQVFPDLLFRGVGEFGGSNDQGTFFFAKGDSDPFLYKNLSGGEKAVFDLILDAVVKGKYFDDSIWCIDEPEAHLNTRVQAQVLDVLVNLLPPKCQMLLSTHSIGYMRRAWELSKSHPGMVSFLDLAGKDFDGPAEISPVAPTRDYWARSLDTALGDLAALISPESIVICEGKPSSQAQSRNAEFDAQCYRTIFAEEFANTDFVSVGSSRDVEGDRLELGRVIETILSGTTVIRVVDRDLRTDEEVKFLRDSGVRVLTERAIENYLFDNEVLVALCEELEQPDKAEAVLRAKSDAIRESVSRQNDPDDLKRAAGTIYDKVRRILNIPRPGSNYESFAKHHLAPLIRPGSETYRRLHADIFDG